MSIPYATATSGDKALLELQRTLAKFGCQSFGTMTDAEKGETIVQFRWRNRDVSLRASWKGYATAWLKDNPYRPRMRCTRQEHDQSALKQAQTSVCSVLRDWVKGQVTAVECGIMSFEAAFMPHMLLATGERVIDRIQAQGLLPAPETGNVVAMVK
jgi:hypothetical protein